MESCGGAIANRKEQYRKQIRRQQIDKYMAQCRSKLLLEVRQGMNDADATDILSKIVPTSLDAFDKSKILLKMMVGSSQTEMKAERSLSSDSKIARSIMLLKQGQSIELFYGDSMTIFSEQELVVCINYMSRQICTRNQEFNLKIRQINKSNSVAAKIPQNLEKMFIEVFNYTSDLHQILSHINILLQASTQVLSSPEHANLGTRMLEAITSCLIELSVFRPRKFTPQLSLSIVQDANFMMKKLRDTLDLQTTSIIHLIASQLTFKIFRVPIVTNIIYVFGNIFVSLSSYESEGKQMFNSVHNLVFAIFEHIFKLLHSDTSFSPGKKEQAQNMFPELASLMIWFIRNELLISSGFYRFKQVNGIDSQKLRQADQKWESILQSIFSYFLLQTQRKPGCFIPQNSVRTIVEAVSVLKLLRNDFNLSIRSIWKAFNSIYSISLAARESHQFSQDLDQCICEFYLEFLRQRYSQISEFNLYRTIANACIEIANKSHITQPQIKLCSKVLTSHGLIQNQQIQQVFQQLCGNFNLLMKAVKDVKDDQPIHLEFVKLARTMIQMSEAMISRNQMEFQFIGQDQIQGLVELCISVWEVESPVSQILATLNFLKGLAYDGRFANHLKAVLLGQGYTQFLENLSAHPNPEINESVYQIFEELELE